MQSKIKILLEILKFKKKTINKKQFAETESPRKSENKFKKIEETGNNFDSHESKSEVAEVKLERENQEKKHSVVNMEEDISISVRNEGNMEQNELRNSRSSISSSIEGFGSPHAKLKESTETEIDSPADHPGAPAGLTKKENSVSEANASDSDEFQDIENEGNTPPEEHSESVFNSFSEKGERAESPNLIQQGDEVKENLNSINESEIEEAENVNLKRKKQHSTVPVIEQAPNGILEFD